MNMTLNGVNDGAWLAFAEFAGPVLALMLVIGLAVSILQTATQIRESSVAFVLKLGGLAALASLGGSFMMGGMEHYAVNLFNAIPSLIHG